MNERPVWTEVATIGDLLVRAAHLHPERAALVFPDTRVTYAQLLSQATGVARGLIALGVPRGAHVGLLMANSAEFAAGLFGIALSGCVAVPLNARHKTTELAFIIDNAELSAVLTTSGSTDYVDFAALIEQALPSLAARKSDPEATLVEAPKLRHLVLMRGAHRTGFIAPSAFAQVAATIEPRAVDAARGRVCVRDTGLVIYTSGTTANPKGCMLSHEACTRGPVERARYRLGAAEGHDVTWGGGPLFHIGSLAPFIGSIGAAGTYLTDVFFDAGRAVRLMQAEGVTLAWPWFSAIVQGLIDHPDFDPRQLARLKHLFLIGPATLVDRVQSLLPHTEVLQACGMTECAGVFALSDPDETSESRSTTQGKASPGIEVRITDPDTAAELPAGGMGEIWVRGYCVMDGYYRDPEKTAAALTPEGWLRTGDLYTRHGDGSLVFGGRLKDMLKVGGENVAAIEVEAFLCSHPEVKLAEVVGRPDARLDEVPVAFVELREGSSLRPEALIDYCSGRIANYKVPRAVYVLAPHEWPMSATKVDKRALRERLKTL
ncbi:MAG TPA: class I adenylate-forming enzyme family protein [Methylibium sp.]|nr:class I adenylate-forming enzyme family protein [Methylibium sp.]